jgi:hypothetical protein
MTRNRVMMITRYSRVESPYFQEGGDQVQSEPEISENRSQLSSRPGLMSVAPDQQVAAMKGVTDPVTGTQRLWQIRRLFPRRLRDEGHGLSPTRKTLDNIVELHIHISKQASRIYDRHRS